MSQSLRREVLKAFKSLHKTRKEVFKNDNFALEKARLKINEEYRMCSGVSDNKKIEELIAYSKAVENEIKTTVIQAKEVKPGVYEATVRKDVVKLDNVPFKDCSG